MQNNTPNPYTSQQPGAYGYNQAPMYGSNYNTAPLSVGQWILTMIVTAIPVVGIVMLLVWAFGNGNVNRQNYARAALIVALIAIVLGILFAATMGAFFSSFFNEWEAYQSLA